MGFEEDKVKKELILKEEQLLDNSIRNDKARLAELISEQCVEISATGKQNHYQPGESFGAVDGAMYIDSGSVRLIDLADDCKLLVYVGAKVVKNSRTKSSHSSVWKKADGKWKMVFHQGTNCSE